jgi:GH24 family phage-related lysozyme (muramidase)
VRHTAAPPSVIPDPVLSPEFLAQIRVAEGVRTVVYDDGVGNPTAGIGHKLPRGSHLEIGDSVPIKEVERWFAQDIQTARDGAELDLDRRHGVGAFNSLALRHQQLLVDLIFNTDDPFPKLKAALVRGDAASAEREATRFAKLGPKGEQVEIPGRSEAAKQMVREGFTAEPR